MGLERSWPIHEIHSYTRGFKENSVYSFAIRSQKSYRTRVYYKGYVYHRHAPAPSKVNDFVVYPLLVEAEQTTTRPTSTSHVQLSLFPYDPKILRCHPNASLLAHMEVTIHVTVMKAKGKNANINE